MNLASFLFLLDQCAFENTPFHLASNGCNMWEMQHSEGLHMLWMHVDGSP